MNRRIGFALATLSLFAPCTNAAQFSADKPMTNRLAALHSGDSMTIAGFPVGPTRSDTIRFERVDVYSPDAHIYVNDGSGPPKEIPRSNLIFLRGYSDDGSSRVAMSLNPDGSVADIGGDGPEGSFVLRPSKTDGNAAFEAQTLDSTLPRDFTYDFTCGNQKENLRASVIPNLTQALAAATTVKPASVAATPAHALRFATVAVDTDSAFMANLFSNNQTTASNWIATMFNKMNLMYERDLLVRLQQGMTFYNTNAATDPYASGTYAVLDIPADTTDLTNFGNYWQANHGSVNRAFAALFSGRGPCSGSSCSASGIAWIDSYCYKPGLYGSYSVVQYFANLSADPNADIAARLQGHELGHNFGAYHTHCTDISNGSAPVGTNTIDQCYSGESYGTGKNCYSGATSCPSDAAGTIMSYCNIKGCGTDHQNLLQFHPTQINDVLLQDINDAPVGCLNTTDDIFFDAFEKPGG